LELNHLEPDVVPVSETEIAAPTSKDQPVFACVDSECSTLNGFEADEEENEANLTENTTGNIVEVEAVDPEGLDCSEKASYNKNVLSDQHGVGDETESSEEWEDKEVVEEELNPLDGEQEGCEDDGDAVNDCEAAISAEEVLQGDAEEEGREKEEMEDDNDEDDEENEESGEEESEEKGDEGGTEKPVTSEMEKPQFSSVFGSHCLLRKRRQRTMDCHLMTL